MLSCRPVACFAVFALSIAFVASVSAQPPIVQPGKPGEQSRVISAEEAIKLATTRYSLHDVRFMADMIPHHQQAMDMSVLVAERTARNELIEVADRIAASQADEIEFMEGWLAERGEDLPDRDWRAHVADDDHAHHAMEGMATAAQMEELADSEGHAFDTLFLELMIKHHEGALTMVEDLLAKSGSAHDPVLHEFLIDVKNDQDAEIDRLTDMLAGFSPDPRVGLAAGIDDAEIAIMNMELVTSLAKPAGFFDPDNPAGLSASRLEELAAVDAEETDEDEAEDDSNGADSRLSLLDFANTDMAFAGDVLAVGSYHGFKLYDIGNGHAPELISAVVCPGGQGDVSIVGDLLIMSVEQNRGRLDCGLMGVAEEVSEERLRGLRIFDISDLALPRQVGAVQTCRGSHTHTVVSSDDERIVVYNSGTSFVRDEEELEGCVDESPWRDEGTALYRIDIIEIPVANPASARIIDSPGVFADPETGILAGLWERGDHGPGTQTSSGTNHCHDITVFPDMQIAAGACSGNGILFDISDPLNPERIDEVVDAGFAYWHSATFNNDGTKVIFTDEWGGGTRPRCRAKDPMHWGANGIYDIVEGKLEFRSYFKMPAPQTEKENCVAHNGSIVPVPGRDIMVQAWYQGGISVFDFTDSANPVEIAYFDRGPIDAEELIPGGFWSAYWYRGLVYGTEITRGLDVLELLPSDYISANELAAARLVDKGDEFNPQQQYQVAWPADPVVARAYIDQLQRAGRLSAARVKALEDALGRANQVPANARADAQLLTDLANLAAAMRGDAQGRDGVDRRRHIALADTLEAIAERL